MPTIFSHFLAILEYNKVDRWNFDGLRNFLDEHLPDSEKSVFYDAILPKMIQMALSLPEQLSQSLPLFKHGTSQKISLSQAQICSILVRYDHFALSTDWNLNLKDLKTARAASSITLILNILIFPPFLGQCIFLHLSQSKCSCKTK